MAFDDIREQCRYRWYNILTSLGIAVREDGKHSPCPICQGTDRFRWDNKEGYGGYFCNQCVKKSGDGFNLVMGVLRVDFKEAVRVIKEVIGQSNISRIKKDPEPKMSKDLLRKIYLESKPIIAGDPVSLYLRRRGLKVVSAKLRYHPSCYEPETHTKMPAMLATYTLPDGTAITMHRTFLTNDGQKANIENPKKILPALRKMSGGAIRLFDIEGKTLNITEGIETALAVREMTGSIEPVWALASSTLMEQFEPPKTIEKVVIFADNDVNYAGQKAAYSLANRLIVQNKLVVKVYIPYQPGDFLDDLIKRKGG